MQLHVGAWAAAIDEDGALWLSDFNYNGLYKYNFETREMQLVHRFEGVGISCEAMHAEMYIRGEEIFLLPLKDDKIRIYNKKTHIETSIKVPKNQKESYSICALREKVWFFDSNMSDRIYCFDLNIKTFLIDEKLSLLCRELIGKTSKIIKKGNYGNNILFFNEEKKDLYCVNMETYEYEKINVSYIKEGISSIFYFKKKYWFLLRESHDIYGYNNKTDVYIRYKANSAEYIGEINVIPYSRMIQWKDELILLNYYGKNIMKISEQNFSLERLFPNEEIILSGNIGYGACYQSAVVSNNLLYFVPQRAKMILECSEKLEITNKFECEIVLDESQASQMLHSIITSKQLEENEELGTIQRYIETVEASSNNVARKDIGINIYKRLGV